MSPPAGRSSLSAQSSLRALYEHEGEDTERYASDSFWDRRYHAERKSYIDRVLQQVIEPGATFLDIGCGTGEYLDTARLAGASQPVGVDLSFAYLRRIGTADPAVSLTQADGLSLPFADDSFDVVLCSEVIEHIPESQSLDVLREIGRVARGTVVITTPNLTAAIRKVARRIVPVHVDRLDAEVGHINLFDAESLRSAGSASGLVALRDETLHILPPVVGEMLHLPQFMSRGATAVERALNRVVPAQGNAMILVCVPSA